MDKVETITVMEEEKGKVRRLTPADREILTRHISEQVLAVIKEEIEKFDRV